MIKRATDALPAKRPDEHMPSGLQPEADDKDPRRRAAGGSDEGVGRRPFTPNSTRCAMLAAADTADPDASCSAFSHSLGRLPVLAVNRRRAAGRSTADLRVRLSAVRRSAVSH